MRPIGPNWNFFVSVGEALTLGDPDAGKFVGGAKFTVHNVSPSTDLVVVWLTVEWDAPLPIISDYLVVPPF